MLVYKYNFLYQRQALQYCTSLYPMTMCRGKVFVTNLFTRVGSKEKSLSDTSITANTGDVLFLVPMFVQQPHSSMVPGQTGIPAPPQSSPPLTQPHKHSMVLLTLSVLTGGLTY